MRAKSEFRRKPVGDEPATCDGCGKPIRQPPCQGPRRQVCSARCGKRRQRDRWNVTQFLLGADLDRAAGDVKAVRRKCPVESVRRLVLRVSAGTAVSEGQ